MISQLEKEITFRFLKARKNDGFLNIISIFSFIGISLGVAVLIIVMSVMNGFRSELINKNDSSALDKANKINLELAKNDIDTIIDDTEENLSSKIKKMNLIGAPYQIIIGKKSEGDLLEFKETGGETQNLPLNKIIEIVTKQKNSI